ncbi:NusG domain II-containing protein [Treponema pedis]|uniref:NusG domain II-containing protein n=1 Tax=Treponema pedis TaxID=409322 RepID=A0A7S6WNY2_9SPIR|nr:NusG domain II-containing protein [Treponema pedis]QOW60092.1 NusG domain II-containing protein [Treponema pedis]
MKEFFKKIKPADILILATALSIIFLYSFFIYSESSSKPYLCIKTPKGEWIYSMEETADIYVEGSIGITNIKIENGEAFVAASDCKNKTCISASRLKEPGDWNACLPNRVFLSVESR